MEGGREGGREDCELHGTLRVKWHIFQHLNLKRVCMSTLIFFKSLPTEMDKQKWRPKHCNCT